MSEDKARASPPLGAQTKPTRSPGSARSLRVQAALGIRCLPDSPTGISNSLLTFIPTLSVPRAAGALCRRGGQASRSSEEEGCL